MLRISNTIEEAVTYAGTFEFPLLIVVHTTVSKHADHAPGDAPRVVHSSSPSSSPVPNDDPTIPTQDAEHTPDNCGVDDDADQNCTLDAFLKTMGKTASWDFPLGKLKGGLEQREAVMAVLTEGRLADACFIHFIEEGTPAYELFSAAYGGLALSGGSPATATDGLLRVHVFPPSRQGFQPLVLHGDLLTPAKLIETVRIAHHVRPQLITSIKDRILDETQAMNQELQRAQAQQKHRVDLQSRSLLSTGIALASKEDQTSHVAEASPNTGLKSGALSSRDAAEAMGRMHFIHIDGLPEGRKKMMLTSPSMTLRTVWLDVSKQLEAAAEKESLDGAARFAPLKNAKAKFYLQIGENATLQTSSDETREVYTIEEASKIILQDFPSSTRVFVKSLELAGACDSSNEKAKDVQMNSNHSRIRHDPTSKNEEKAASMMTCDSIGCCRKAISQEEAQFKVPRTEEDEQQTSTAAVPGGSPLERLKDSPNDENRQLKENKEVASSVSYSSIDIRCSLADGRTETISGLNPEVDTLNTCVRPAIVRQLGHNNFIFARPYPPKRFSVQEDELRPLSQIDLTVSSTLRVIPSSVGQNHQPAQIKNSERETGSSHFTIPTSVATASSGFFNRISRLFPRGDIASRHASPSAAGPSTHTNTHVASREPFARHQGSTSGGFQSMSNILAAQEEKERQMALEQLQMAQRAQLMGFPSSLGSRHSDPVDQKKKAEKGNKPMNHYFGGDSTEMIAPPMNDERSPAESGNEEIQHSSGSGQAKPRTHIPFSGAGRSLADQSSIRESEDRKSNEMGKKKS
ncbi:unnamed protein product [Phytomonas sp. EM1]|nr:unnamed protein product [Phytomonas sp. EM1]|eukprot:CCW64881.1 unnamed protein product [Phytomonas sp. isolate EM1]